MDNHAQEPHAGFDRSLADGSAPLPGSPLVQFNAAKLSGDLASRQSHWLNTPDEVAERDLGRYYEILRVELRAVQLSEGEAMALCDRFNGTRLDAWAARNLAWLLEDGLEDGLAAKWGFDGPALVERLRAMPPARLVAVADAVERWWVSGDADQGPSATGLARVGLIRHDGGVPDPQ